MASALRSNNWRNIDSLSISQASGALGLLLQSTFVAGGFITGGDTTPPSDIWCISISTRTPQACFFGFALPASQSASHSVGVSPWGIWDFRPSQSIQKLM